MWPVSLLKSTPDGGNRPPEGKETIDSGEIRKAIGRFTTEDRQIEIQREGSVPARLFLAEANGIDVQVGFSDDVFTYELKIPKQSKPEYPYSIAPVTGKPMTIGLETAARPKGEGGGRRGSWGDGPGGGRPGGSGPGGGRPPGGMCGGGFGRGGDWPADAPLKLWIRIRPLETEEK